METIVVGVIGASTLRPGWAMNAHIPVLRALPQFKLGAVSTSSRKSAIASEKTLGVPAFHDARQLIDDPAVQLVVITVKVPHHYELAAMAIDAGKMVFCEWPLGTDLAQTLELSARAEATAGTPTPRCAAAHFTTGDRLPDPSSFSGLEATTSDIFSRNAAHLSKASSAGQSACPHFVREYSTFGGTCGWTMRRTMPSASIWRSCWMSIFCDTAGAGHSLPEGKRMPLELPEPIAAFFAAQNGDETKALALYFAEGSVVRDEGRTIEGLTAIGNGRRKPRRNISTQSSLWPLQRRTERPLLRAVLQETSPAARSSFNSSSLLEAAKSRRWRYIDGQSS